ncbi:MAG TPA: tetratricopeptide repeat protein [Thermoanaerobaculia bacterium]|nr:tetratricopeptide repeat protein [Thermoanaerobaculia bacterium]
MTRMWRQRLLLAALVGSLTAVVVARADDLGRIDFPTSGSGEAQKHFLRGALLLHSFEFDDAAEEFRAAEKAEPGFAMAYWGEAMTFNHPLWMEQDAAAARKALEELAPTPEGRLAKAPTEREKMYLSAVEALYGKGDKAANDKDYAEAMRRLHEKFPEDENAAAFYALALLGTCEGKRDFPTYMKAAAVAEDVFAKNPLHPGAVHYLIHSYDDPVHAPLGMRAARVYAKIAPAAGHALHMPSHIFFASGMWEEAAASNEAAWKASLDRADRKKLGPDDPNYHNYHALLWLEYSYLQLGRYGDARKALAAMEEDAGKSGSNRAKTHLAMMRAAYVVETRRFDGDVARSLSGSEKGVALFAEGFAAAGRKDWEGARKAAASIGKETTEPHHGGGSMYAMRQASEASADAVMKKELEALLAASAGPERGVALAKAAAAAEDTMSFDFGPPDVAKPAHELLGEMLFSAGKSAEARAEFERSLAGAPNRALSLLGLARAATKAGDRPASEDAYRRLAAVWRYADPDLPEVAEVRRSASPIAAR